MSEIDRRAFLAALAAVPLAPLALDNVGGIAIRLVREWTITPEPVRLAFHPDAFAFVMSDLLIVSGGHGYVLPRRLPRQMFDPARLPL